MDAAEFWAIRAGGTEIENPISPHKLDLLATIAGSATARDEAVDLHAPDRLQRAESGNEQRR
ncbi:hypothetical protein [Inquilinus sp. CA228]|uniref:hypothetical protein n=1 Tax=Inquilinus sp. CA228 TaxID=3455609 RepID=UPI003F8D5493